MTDTVPAIARLLTRKGSVGTTERDETPARMLRPGEVLMKLDRFSITTNNITYAAFGDAMDYWKFFPTGRDGLGHMPVWGFAHVAASTVDGVAPGESFYGYWPIADHFVIQPTRVTERGLYDGAPHRQALVSAYNFYTRCSTDPVWKPGLEDLLALYRPLFLTSFLNADFLEDNGFFGARRVVVSSASSKTAYGAAFEMAGKGLELAALTSPRNLAFTRALGLYDRVAPYADLEQLPADAPTLYLDYSGDAELRGRVHRHFGPALVYDCFVGSAQSTAFIADADLPGPKPQFFFAALQVKKRNADWGPLEMNRRFGEAQSRFFTRAGQAGAEWVRIRESRGLDAAAQIIADLYAGRADPLDGHIVVLD
ncbi:MAG: DUF2855 family protein [Caulobacteraceae bacterium]|nr:DUF2855 family protein [Caulobacteraceae bacterium]